MKVAIAVFDGKKVKGTCRFIYADESVIVKVDLQGLPKNSLHGFHIHQYGDLSEGCDSMCAHFNPYNKTHGGRHSVTRHLGDLGNIEADDNGEVHCTFQDKHIKLSGSKANIVGRGLIIHEDVDDCGQGNNEASLVTGNSGKRIACAVIGWARENVK